MCKHILNAQVAIRAPCCKEWFDCAECHAERKDHTLKQITELTFACKKCKKVFRKQADEWDAETDEFCPWCDNHFVIEAKIPKPALTIESDDTRMDNKMLKDDRQRLTWQHSIWDPDADADKLG